MVETWNMAFDMGLTLGYAVCLKIPWWVTIIPIKRAILQCIPMCTPCWDTPISSMPCLNHLKSQYEWLHGPGHIPKYPLHIRIKCYCKMKLSSVMTFFHYGAFLKWGYPQIIQISRGFSSINDPAIGVATWPWQTSRAAPWWHASARHGYRPQTCGRPRSGRHWRWKIERFTPW